MKISFLLSYSPNPRIMKRIRLIEKTYVTSLISWKRTSDYIWGKATTDIENVEINIPTTNGNPLERLIPTLKFASKALWNLKRIQPDCIYVQNIDMLFIARLYNMFGRRKVKIIYEIADVHSLIIDTQVSIKNKVIQRVLRRIDKWLCKSIDILVNTSDKFYEIYYSDFVPEEKLVVMPNIPDIKVFKDYNRKSEGKFTIGFIGAIRYKKQMKMLINAAEKNNVNVIFAGAGLDNEIKDLCEGKENIKYLGEYNYNNDIADLYGMVDCVFSLYDADLFNVRIALPNKLYEAIYCELPIIVAKNTYLSELVEGMGVGIAVSHTHERELELAINKLATNKKYYSEIVDACHSQKENINIEFYNKKLKSKIEEVMET